jgi:hypothetical protein
MTDLLGVPSDQLVTEPGSAATGRLFAYCSDTEDAAPITVNSALRLVPPGRLVGHNCQLFVCLNQGITTRGST